MEAPEETAGSIADLQALPEVPVATLLDAALADELPLLRRDGGFVRTGHHEDLDEMRALRDESRKVIAGLQHQYAGETGVKSLKIKHNNVLGYFIEVTAGNASALTDGDAAKARFIHRQTMANAMRFTTTELADLESRIANAADRALTIELEIFEHLTGAVTGAAQAINRAALAIAVIDVSAALARLAEEQGYCRPTVDLSTRFRIVGGRHPVVEQALREQAEGPFVANDCDLSPAEGAQEGTIWLLTGPNMGGKSTFLRQNALIAILAQMGSFVPAGSAEIGVVDRLFSRVGASDDLARGRSTFMVEMVETAAILNQASERSLVILDEIGRGTATFDGLSIAWAAVEHLHAVNRCRGLFATHFHELTVLSEKLERLRQRHHAGQGMGRRRDVPARGRTRGRRPLLRHPGGAPCRPAGIGGRAGPRRAQPAGRRRASEPCPAADRRPAAVFRRGQPRAGATRRPLGDRRNSRRYQPGRHDAT